MLFQAYVNKDYEDMNEDQALDKYLFMLTPKARYSKLDGDVILIAEVTKDERYKLPF